MRLFVGFDLYEHYLGIGDGHDAVGHSLAHEHKFARAQGEEAVNHGELHLPSAIQP